MAAKRQTTSSRAEDMLRRLADDGLRVTGQRETVVRAVADKPGAFSPEGLVDELRPGGIGRATVYRALEQLEKRGMLSRIHMDGCHGYTVCEEGHHHHLVCSTCGRVVEIDATAIEAAITRLANDLNFRVATHTLEFSGTCESCLSDSAALTA
jgi:Fur family ferric uptake transcriptional regulator